MFTYEILKKNRFIYYEQAQEKLRKYLSSTTCSQAISRVKGQIKGHEQIQIILSRLKDEETEESLKEILFYYKQNVNLRNSKQLGSNVSYFYEGICWAYTRVLNDYEDELGYEVY